MTKHDILTLILKIFGLYWAVKTLINVIPEYLQTFQFFGIYDSSYAWVYRIIAILTIIVSIGLAYALIVNAGYLVKRFNLAKGFDDESEARINFSEKHIISLATIIVGGYMVLIHLPDLISYCVMAFADSARVKGVSDFSSEGFLTTANTTAWIMTAVKTLIGFYLLTNYKLVNKWLRSRKALNQQLDDGLEA